MWMRPSCNTLYWTDTVWWSIFHIFVYWILDDFSIISSEVHGGRCFGPIFRRFFDLFLWITWAPLFWYRDHWIRIDFIPPFSLVLLSVDFRSKYRLAFNIKHYSTRISNIIQYFWRELHGTRTKTGETEWSIFNCSERMWRRSWNFAKNNWKAFEKSVANDTIDRPPRSSCSLSEKNRNRIQIFTELSTHFLACLESHRYICRQRERGGNAGDYLEALFARLLFGSHGFLPSSGERTLWLDFCLMWRWLTGATPFAEWTGAESARHRPFHILEVVWDHRQGYLLSRNQHYWVTSN